MVPAWFFMIFYGFSWFQVGFSWFPVDFPCFLWLWVDFHNLLLFQEMGGQIVNNPKIIGPKMSKMIEK